MSDAPTGTEATDGGGSTWEGLAAPAPQAMAWGIELCGQLASIHVEGIVVGGIAPGTITWSRPDRPQLPEPDPRTTHDPWVDVSALAAAIGAIVPDPPPELTEALRPPYASAVALGQELQDAQRAMGLPTTPIPFDDAPLSALASFPLDAQGGARTGEREPTEGPEGGADPDPRPPAAGDHRRPDLQVLLLVALVVALVVALAMSVL